MSTMTPPRRTARSRIGWTWLLLSSLAVVAFAVTPYFTQSLAELAASDTGLASGYEDRPLPLLIVFYTHVVFGGLALLLSPFQFWAGLRERYPRIHRTVGRIYLVAVAIGGVAAVALAPFNTAGFVGFFGFGALGVFWLYASWRGYRAIRAGERNIHRAWMMRSFALTYAAVTLRLWLGLLIAVQLPFAGSAPDVDAMFRNAYAAVPFMCWLPNIVVAELIIRRAGLPTILAPRAAGAGRR
ncbi:UNVERIFIED_CONTAM: DUF2306 domain-containing protein [Microbacterium sp. SLM126]